MAAEEPRSWRGKEKELALVSSVVDRELDDFTSRDDAMRGRATILIGAASVVGALQLGEGFNLLLAISVVLSLAAAMCGIVVVFPRTGGAFNPRTMWEHLYDGKGVDEALHHMIRVKLKALDREEASLAVRSWFARVGLLLIVASIVFAAASAMLPSTHADPAPSPTQAPTT